MLVIVLVCTHSIRLLKGNVNILHPVASLENRTVFYPCSICLVNLAVALWQLTRRPLQPLSVKAEAVLAAVKALIASSLQGLPFPLFAA